MRLHFLKPSSVRIATSIVIAYIVASVASGTAYFLFTAAFDEYHYSTGELVRAYIMDVLLWGQSYILIPWFITFPIIIALGVLIASLRRRGTNDSDPQAQPNADDGWK